MNEDPNRESENVSQAVALDKKGENQQLMLSEKETDLLTEPVTSSKHEEPQLSSVGGAATASNSEVMSELSSPSKDSTKIAPTEPNVDPTDIKSILEVFYRQYNPEKITTIDHILDRYNGNVIELLKNLKEKYAIDEYKLFDDFIASYVPPPAPKIGGDLSPSDKEPPKPAPAGTSSSSAGLGSISIGMQDISTNLAGRFLGWGIGDASTVGGKKRDSDGSGMQSSQDEALWMSRVNSLQAEITALQTEKAALESANKKLNNQLLNHKKEASALKNDNTELKTRLENLQRNVVDVVDRESRTIKESQSISDQLKSLERLQQDFMTKLEKSDRQKANKHRQLLDVIQLNHRLEAQVRYLTVHAYGSISEADLAKVEKRMAAVSAASTPAATASADATPVADGDKKDVLDEKYGQFLKNVPEAEDLAATLSYFDQDHVELATKSKEELEELVRSLWRANHVLQSSYAASRVELRLETKQCALAEERTLEQQQEIEKLKERLSGILNELETASGSADNLTRQIADANAEIAYYKSLLRKAETSLAAKTAEMQAIQQELASAKETLRISESTREHLSRACNERIRDIDGKANEYVNVMRERLLFEWEEMHSQMQQLIQMAQAMRLAASNETQHELHRLREELFKSRRNETQKERESAYLQRQLAEAAKKLAQMVLDKEQENKNDV